MRDQVEMSVDCCDDSLTMSHSTISCMGTLDGREVQSRGTCVAFQRMIEACKQKNLEAIKSVIEQQPELVNLCDKHNRSLLHYAAILLVESASNSAQATSSKSIECFNYLKSQCEPKLWLQQDSDGLSSLHLAVISSNVLLVRHIVSVDYEYQTHSSRKTGSIVNLLDNESHSSLHWAVITNSLECVKILVESFAGAKIVEQADLNGATPLHYATQVRDYPKYRQQLRLMLKQSTETSESAVVSTTMHDKLTPSAQQDESNASFNQIRSSDGLEILEYFVSLPKINLECKDKDQRTPLLWAASSGNRGAILLLANRGANLRSYDRNKLSALHCAASHGYTDCLECLLSLTISKNDQNHATLLNHVNQPDNLSCTPLFYAVLSGNIDCVETLIEKGAKMDWQDSKGRTAAHFAALRGQLNSLKLLQERQANLWLANKQGDLPLHYAIKSGRLQVAKWLLEQAPYEHSVNAINNFGRSPIHLAVMKNNLEMVNYLISSQANLNQLVKVRDKSKIQQKERKSLGQSDVREPSTKTNNSIYRYETALDMALRLNHRECLNMLKRNHALSAAQVIQKRGGLPGLRKESSLFGFQTAQNSSPIGFETSCSSASPATEVSERQQVASNHDEASRQQIPQAPQPPQPERLLNSDDSTGSSALSQSSLTSLRNHSKSSMDQQQKQLRKGSTGKAETVGDEKPYSGGISYNNEHVSASIKYKLYDGIGTNNISFPPLNRTSNGGPFTKNSLRTAISAPITNSYHRGGQAEIVTNVNVYTSSPCSHHCVNHHQEECTMCNRYQQSQAAAKEVRLEKDGRVVTNYCSYDTSSSDASVVGESPEQQQQHLPNLVDNDERHPVLPSDDDVGSGHIRGHLRSHLPPSQNFAQHLPVIMSDQSEQSNSPTSNGCESVPVPDHSPDGVILQSIHRSPAEQEPRFDRADRARNLQRLDRYREQVRSPVAEYIRSNGQQEPRRSVSLNKAQDAGSSRGNKHTGTNQYSQVRAKVDSHRLPHVNSSDANRSKSVSTLSTTAAKSEVAPLRSLSRQTVISTNADEVQMMDDDELTTRVEKAIRKYRQEKRLFEELQNLKQSQIRSGRANEALLVKRLADHFRQDDSLAVLGLNEYHGPYSYSLYERFLYDQLRKLSQSNCVKLQGQYRDRHLSSSCSSNGQILTPSMDYLEEDLAADWELRRVIDSATVNGAEQSLEDDEAMNQQQQHLSQEENLTKEHENAGKSEGTSTFPSSYELAPANVDNLANEAKVESETEVEQQVESEEQESELEPVQVESSQLEPSQVEPLQVSSRRSSVSSINSSSSRRSSVEIERERLSGLALRTTEQQLEDEADQLSASIIVDALGNISRAGSASHLRQDQVIKEEENTDAVEEVDEKEPEQRLSPSTGRRRSVVNIGNKLEVIYHDVGIEIEHAESPSAKSNDKVMRMLEEVNEQSELEDSSTSVVEEPLEESPEVQRGTEDEKQAGESVEPIGNTESKEDEVDDEDKVKLPTEATKSTIGRGRRDSSPPAYRLRGKKSTETLESFTPPATISRHASLGKISVSSQTMTANKKKIFSGYDLDEMHQKRSPRGSSNKLLDERQVAADSDQSDSVTASTSEPETPVVQQKICPATPRTPIRKRRLARSKLLKGRYKPKVSIDLIKRRWLRIKAQERRRLLKQVNQNGGVEYTLGSHGGFSAKQQMAKSQPNLEQDQKVDSEMFEDQANYTLLYELNKDIQSRSMIDKKIRPVAQWCHRKALRIVDVRTLKRTLSLPESLIYSNNLLRRFEILKL